MPSSVDLQLQRARKSGVIGAILAVVLAGGLGTLAFGGSDSALVTTLSRVGIVLVITYLVMLARRYESEVDRLAASEDRFRSLVQQATDVTLIVSERGVVRFASPSVSRLFRLSETEIVGHDLAELVHAEDMTSLQHLLASSQPGVMVEWRVRRGDAWVWTENTCMDMRGHEAIEGLVVNMRDISERRSLEARLTHQAYHDSLTRLANRALFLNRVSQAIVRAPRARRPSAVLFLDLDDFKRVNDSLGHAAGDDLLVLCAKRLEICVRPGDTIARLGGDEFAMLLEGITGLADAVHVAERVGDALRQAFIVHGREVSVGVSIGIAEVTADSSPDEVLRNADLAMYSAKGRDKGRYSIFAPEMHEQLVERLELEGDLRAAVAAGDITLEYQPIVRLGAGELYGAEALVRWVHPRRGVVSPSTFVAIAEETGLIVPLGRDVLRSACAQMREWHRRRPGAGALRLSVNVSGRHFMEPSVVDDVAAALDGAGLAPSSLTIEITESVLMQRADTTLEKLSALKRLGVRLAIDDFGTGYSSLGYLQRFPIDILKIDRTFVESVADVATDPVLVRAIIALGQTLQIETIAEGIESAEQRDGLRGLGCELGQGYFYSRSLTPDAFDRMLATHFPRRRPTPGTAAVVTSAPAL